MQPVRTRFAPSPTGFLHLGGARTALFAFLLARHSKGQFILRIEDTDKAREAKGAKEHIVECLNTLGLTYDEGPEKGGPYGPYIQSQRLELYQKWAKKLVEADRAYSDPYSPGQLDEFRHLAKKNKRPFLFRNHRPDKLDQEIAGKPIRFKSEPKAYAWKDLVMGDLSTGPEVIDDFILIKSDGYPTYNFAHVIDDLEMKISHVLRGQEFLASVPNYLNLYEALGLEPPKYATLPHVLGPDGNKKLSKRDGAKDVLDYIKAGYLAEALNSFMASLGWNDGTEQEIFTMKELINKFDISKVQRSGARFDSKRLDWINGHFIRKMSLGELYEQAVDFWPSESSSYPKDYKLKVLGLIQERLKYFSELPELSIFFFKDLPLDLSLIKDNPKLSKLSDQEILHLLNLSYSSLEKVNFEVGDITKALNDLLESTGQKPVVLFSLIRIATTESPASPALAETLAVLGKEVSLRRIEALIKSYSSAK